MTWGYGKIILFGEHAVVHGHPALACAIDRGVNCSAQEDEQSRITIPDWGIDLSLAEDHPVATACRVIAEALPGPSFSLAVSSSLPARAGLGSSAAFVVAVTKALAALRQVELPTPDIERIANSAEAVFHDNPSGVDVALAARGGHGLFIRGRGLESIEAPPLTLAVGLSGQDRQTGAMVSGVAERRRDAPDVIEPLLDELGELARNSIAALSAGDAPAIGVAMQLAHAALNEIGVGAPVLDQMVEVANKAGAYGCKLTGAGGGGAVIAVASDTEAICQAWRDAGFASFTCQAGVAP